MKLHIALIAFFICIISCENAAGQAYWPYTQLWETLKVNANKDVQYDYRVVIEDLEIHQNMDSIQGSLIYAKSGFLDSNSQYLVGRYEGKYCKLDFMEKSAILFDLKSLQGKMKSKISDAPNQVFALTQDILTGAGNKLVFDVSNKKFLKVTVTTENDLLHKAVFTFLKENNTLVSAHFEIDDLGIDGHESYRSKYDIYNVRYTIDFSKLNLSRFFIYSNEKFKLLNKYRDYKIIKLI